MADKTDIDNLIRKLRKARFSESLKPTGIMMLLVPIKYEMAAAQAVALNVRRKAIRQLFMDEMTKYDVELRLQGKAMPKFDY